MSKNIITKLKKCQKLLSDKNIKKLLLNYEKDYTLKQVNDKYIRLGKETQNSYEIVEIYSNSFVRHSIYEKREHGIIVTDLELSFDYTAYSKKEKQLIHLIEKRFVLTNFKLRKLFNDIHNLNIKELYSKLLTIPIVLDADMKTCFSTYIDHMIKDNNGKYVQNYMLFTRAFLNGNDISKIYDGVNGNDRLYRVYDLYNGITNERNKKDIQNIANGILESSAFDYKKIMGITEKENNLVGKQINKSALDFYIEKIKRDNQKHLKLIKSSKQQNSMYI